MASARAAPRASSRSRHSLPVAERATPRNAGGNSTGNADAGSVMMLSIDGHVSRLPQTSCPGRSAARKRCAAAPGSINRRVGSRLCVAPLKSRRAASGTWELAPHLVGYPVKILGHDVPIAPGLEIVFLVRAVFGRPRHEGGLES